MSWSCLRLFDGFSLHSATLQTVLFIFYLFQPCRLCKFRSKIFVHNFLRQYDSISNPHRKLLQYFFDGAADGPRKVLYSVPIPVSVQDWHAGIANAPVQYSATSSRKIEYFSFGLMIACFYMFLYIYLFVALSIIAIPVTILTTSVISHFPYVNHSLYYFLELCQ